MISLRMANIMLKFSTLNELFNFILELEAIGGIMPYGNGSINCGCDAGDQFLTALALQIHPYASLVERSAL